MTSHSRREERSMFTPETPHFFKIILEKTILDGNLGIPRKFAKKYGNGMPSKALLQVPSGAVWQVELCKCDGRIWLQNGWKEFAEYYSLRRGHLLVFRYERNNRRFHVSIFDKSASEIEYPFTKLPHSDKHLDSESEDQASMEILEDIATCSKKTREKSPIQSPRPQKMMKTSTTAGAELENGNEHTSSSRSEQSFSGRPKTSDGIQRDMDINGPEYQEQAHHIQRFQKLTAEEKGKAVQIANAFKSENPFFLIIVDQISYISDRYRMGIPASFARKYLKQTHKAEAILCLDSDGKTWSVRYFNVQTNRGRTSAQVRWREFVLDNNLGAGDICVFELLRGTNTVSFKVIIHRDFKDAKCYPSQEGGLKSCKRIQRGMDMNGPECQEQAHYILRFEKLRAKEKAEALQIADAFKSDNPFFLAITDQMSHISHKDRMGIPVGFARKYLRETRNQGKAEATLCLDSDEKTWSAGYFNVQTNERRTKAQLYCREFFQDNKLAVGDVCVFELLEGTNTVSFKVAIHRNFKDPKCYPSQQEVAAIHKSTASIDCKGRLAVDLESEVSSYDKGTTSSRREKHGNRNVSGDEAGSFTNKKYETSKVDSIQANMAELMKYGKGPAEDVAEVSHEDSSTFASKYPYFKRTIASAHVNGNVDIPYGFIENHFEPNVSEVMLQVADRLWPVTLKRYPKHRQGKLTSGFIQFVKENSIRVGDVCVFDQIASRNAMLKVSIFRR